MVVPLRTSLYESAMLPKVSLDAIVQGCPKAERILLNAARQDGIFYLKLDSLSGASYLDVVQNMFGLAESYFAKPLENKLADCLPDEITAQTAGFKPLAPEAGVRERTKDGFEAYKIPTNNIFLEGERSAADAISRSFDFGETTAEDFIRESHHLCNLVMTCLTRSLKISNTRYFADCHKPELASSSAAVVNHYPLAALPDHASAGHNAHTDLGSITLLFCSDWGLQVYSDASMAWTFVPPLDGHAIVKIVDTLCFLSDMRLRSCIHRVIPHEDWRKAPRYSVAYFARPNSNITVSDVEGRTWSVEDWVNRKFRSYKEPHSAQAEELIQIERRGLSRAFNPTEEAQCVNIGEGSEFEDEIARALGTTGAISKPN